MVDAEEHTVVVPDMEAAGSGFTVTLLLAVAVQLEAFVTVTVYVVFADGETVTAVVAAPVLQM